MKAKTIKSVLSRKFKAFVDSIDDPEIKNLVKENTIITGGAIASMLLGEKVNDYDMYFRTRDAASKIANYYLNKFKENPPTKFKWDGKPLPMWVETLEDRVKIVVKSAGVASADGTDDYRYFEGVPDPDRTEVGEYVEEALEVVNQDKNDNSFRPIFLTSNAITLSDKVQLVTRFFGDPAEIHENYDFVHCTNYWTSWDRDLVLRPEALESLLARELKYVGSKYPLCSFIRTRKFIQRGWTINAGQYLKMGMQLSQLDLNDLGTLEDQLVGVDFAYFIEIINLLKAKNDERVDTAYLVELVDRIF